MCLLLVFLSSFCSFYLFPFPAYDTIAKLYICTGLYWLQSFAFYIISKFEPHSSLMRVGNMNPSQMRKLRLGWKIASELQEHFEAQTVIKTLHLAQGRSICVAKPNLPNILLGG